MPQRSPRPSSRAVRSSPRTTSRRSPDPSRRSRLPTSRKTPLQLRSRSRKRPAITLTPKQSSTATETAADPLPPEVPPLDGSTEDSDADFLFLLFQIQIIGYGNTRKQLLTKTDPKYLLRFLTTFPPWSPPVITRPSRSSATFRTLCTNAWPRSTSPRTNQNFSSKPTNQQSTTLL